MLKYLILLTVVVFTVVQGNAIKQKGPTTTTTTQKPTITTTTEDWSSLMTTGVLFPFHSPGKNYKEILKQCATIELEFFCETFPDNFCCQQDKLHSITTTDKTTDFGFTTMEGIANPQREDEYKAIKRILDPVTRVVRTCYLNSTRNFTDLPINIETLIDRQKYLQKQCSTLDHQFMCNVFPTDNFCCKKDKLESSAEPDLGFKKMDAYPDIKVETEFEKIKKMLNELHKSSKLMDHCIAKWIWKDE